MSTLVTTNIRVPREDYDLYRAIAAEEGESFAELVRKILAEKFKGKKKSFRKNRYSLYDLGTKFVTRGGDPFASQKIDEVVYKK